MNDLSFFALRPAAETLRNEIYRELVLKGAAILLEGTLVDVWEKTYKPRSDKFLDVYLELANRAARKVYEAHDGGIGGLGQGMGE